VFPRSLPHALANGLLEALGSVTAVWYTRSTCPHFRSASNEFQGCLK
jgi:hypothetical protein